MELAQALVFLFALLMSSSWNQAHQGSL